MMASADEMTALSTPGLAHQRQQALGAIVRQRKLPPSEMAVNVNDRAGQPHHLCRGQPRPAGGQRRVEPEQSQGILSQDSRLLLVA